MFRTIWKPLKYNYSFDFIPQENITISSLKSAPKRGKI